MGVSPLGVLVIEPYHVCMRSYIAPKYSLKSYHDHHEHNMLFYIYICICICIYIYTYIYVYKRMYIYLVSQVWLPASRATEASSDEASSEAVAGTTVACQALASETKNPRLDPVSPGLS